MSLYTIIPLLCNFSYLNKSTQYNLCQLLVFTQISNCHTINSTKVLRDQPFHILGEEDFVSRLDIFSALDILLFKTISLNIYKEKHRARTMSFLGQAF